MNGGLSHVLCLGIIEQVWECVVVFFCLACVCACVCVCMHPLHKSE